MNTLFLLGNIQGVLDKCIHSLLQGIYKVSQTNEYTLSSREIYKVSQTNVYTLYYREYTRCLGQMYILFLLGNIQGVLDKCIHSFFQGIYKVSQTNEYTLSLQGICKVSQTNVYTPSSREYTRCLRQMYTLFLLGNIQGVLDKCIHSFLQGIYKVSQTNVYTLSYREYTRCLRQMYTLFLLGNIQGVSEK